MATQRDERYGPHQMRVDNHVKVTMRDGVTLSCRVYRPEGDGQFPALFAASLREIDTLFTDRALPRSLAGLCAEWGTRVEICG